ncbi:site-specific tyrosine recombinase XerD [Timonella sp. A28]|uniref:site-specific tyrosine recombinase XerD n=1 Tax=Timonella sp. A28 TaxID=3442640 RepID=UPI003EBFDC71
MVSAHDWEKTYTRHTHTYLNHLIVEKGRSRNTVESYRRDLVRCGRVFSHFGLDPLAATSLNIEQLLTDVRQGSENDSALSETSTARLLASLRGFYRFLCDENIITADPTAGLKPPKSPQRLPKVLSVENVTQLLDAPPADTSSGIRDRAFLEFLYSTGARVTEATSIDIDDILSIKEDGVIRLTGKGRKQRLVPVGRYAQEALDAYLVRVRPIFAQAGTGTPALFLNSRGRRLSRQSAWAIIRSAAQRANVDHLVDVSPHILRHSYATHLLNGGADVRVVQELLGHASVTTTQLYTHVSPDSLREVFMSSHPRALK